MTLSLSKLQDCAERAVSKRRPSIATIESLAFHQALYPDDVLALIRVARACLEAQAKFMSITDMAMPSGGCVPPEFLPISIALKEIEL